MVCNSYLTGAIAKLFWMGHYFLLSSARSGHAARGRGKVAGESDIDI